MGAGEAAQRPPGSPVKKTRHHPSSHVLNLLGGKAKHCSLTSWPGLTSDLIGVLDLAARHGNMTPDAGSDCWNTPVHDGLWHLTSDRETSDTNTQVALAQSSAHNLDFSKANGRAHNHQFDLLYVRGIVKPTVCSYMATCTVKAVFAFSCAGDFGQVNFKFSDADTEPPQWQNCLSDQVQSQQLTLTAGSWWNLPSNSDSKKNLQN